MDMGNENIAVFYEITKFNIQSTNNYQLPNTNIQNVASKCVEQSEVQYLKVVVLFGI